MALKTWFESTRKGAVVSDPYLLRSEVSTPLLTTDSQGEVVSGRFTHATVENVMTSKMGHKLFFARSTQSVEDSVDRSAPAFFVGYGLVGALLLLGAIGYVLDRWLGATQWLLIGGVVTPLVLGFAGLVRISRRR